VIIGAADIRSAVDFGASRGSSRTMDAFEILVREERFHGYATAISIW
jgi:hypothetical protein